MRQTLENGQVSVKLRFTLNFSFLLYFFRAISAPLAHRLIPLNVFWYEHEQYSKCLPSAKDLECLAITSDYECLVPECLKYTTFT